MILGTISAVDADNGLQLIIDGEDLPTTKKYTYMASYVPTANDRVLIEEISGSYVIMGKVINEVSASGIARMADTATNATNAVNATSATNATNATNADSALTAAKATQADGLSNIAPSQYGSLVTNVSRTYSSQLGGYYVSDISLSLATNYVTK